MRRRHVTLVAVVTLFAALTVPTLADDVTISGTVLFSSIDGSSADHDGAVNGVFTVDDGNLLITGTVSCNDDAPAPVDDSACSMQFNVSGNLTLGPSSYLVAENRRGQGNGGNITLTVGGDLTLQGAADGIHGARVFTSRVAGTSSAVETGGTVAMNVSGNVTLELGTMVAANAANAKAGTVTINGGGQTALLGRITSGPSSIVLPTALTGRVLDGTGHHQVAGNITVTCTGFAEPGITVGSQAMLVSQGNSGAAGAVTLSGCGIVVKGLIASLSKKDAVSRVALLSGTGIVIDGSDFGVPAVTTGGGYGRVRADGLDEGAKASAVDVYAQGAIQILGPDPSLSALFAVTANPEASKNDHTGGVVRVMSVTSTLTASGNAIQAAAPTKDQKGGSIVLQAKGRIVLDGGFLSAKADDTTNTSIGGSITIQSYGQDLSWVAGGGDVRPVGNAVGPFHQGRIIITTCGPAVLTGSQFPTNGAPIPPFPQLIASCPATDPVPPHDISLPTCADVAPSVNSTSPSSGAIDVAPDANIIINFSEAVNVAGSSAFTLECPAGTPVPFALTPTPPGATNSFTLDPTSNLPAGAICTVTVAASEVTDVDSNDPPDTMAGNYAFSFTVADTAPTAVADLATVAEDSGATAIDVLANDANPDGGPITVNVASDPANGTVVITGGGTGLTYQPDADYCNSPAGKPDMFTYTLNGGSIGDVAVTVTCVNDAPSFTKGADEAVLQNSGAHSVPDWATAISPGPADEASQVVTFEVTNNTNAALFTVAPAVSSAGTLSYTVAASTLGSATITLQAKDDGGITNGGVDTSATQSFVINVSDVNDAPSFTKGADQTVNEDAGAQSVAGWATAISAGPGEGGQVVDFVIDSNTNTALFLTGPSVAPDGTLTYTPAADQNGVATITLHIHDDGGIANGGVDTSATQSFTITVNAVNDAPSFTKGADETVVEDSGLHTVTNWATAISAGPADEAGQTVTFEITNNTNAALFAVAPAVDGAGTLTYTLAADAAGSATITLRAKDDGGITNGGVDVSATQTFDITVSDVNDAPSFTKGADQTVNEDAGPQSVSGWATGISAGPNEGTQVVDFVIDSNTNTALFSAGPSVAADGTLTYTPAADQNGVATITLHIHDDGGVAGGGVDASATQSFTITVNALNDAPSFTKGADQTVLEDSGAQTVNGWATAISPGPADETSQTVTFEITGNTTPALFAIAPAVDGSGNLTYTLAANQFGSSTITLRAKDDGGTTGGGVDTSATQSFVINVTGVNDAPSFVKGADQTVNEDASPQSVTGWATSISAGPNEAGQVVNFVIDTNTNTSLFSAGPTVTAAGTLTYTLAANQNGVATITLHIEDDGGTANSGVDASGTQSFTITVNAVNDAPVVTNKTYGPGAVQTNMKIVGLTGLLLGVTDADAGINGCTPAFTVTGVSGSTSPSGGAVTVTNASAGTFDFDPPPGVTGNVTFTYTVQDDGCPGTATSAAATVTVNVAGPVIWFVNPAVAGPGDGRLSNPFKFLTGNAGILNDADDVDAAGHSIFVYTGTVSGGITLNTSEALIGQGAFNSPSTFDLLMGIAPPAGTIARPSIGGTRPTVANTSGTAITLGSSNVVKGLNVTNSNGSGITGAAVGTLVLADFDSTVTGGTALSAITSGTITATGTDNDLTASNGTALNVNGVTIGGANLTFKSIASNGGGTAIALVNTGAGQLMVTGIGTTGGSGGTIENKVGADAITLNNTGGLITLKNMIIEDITAAGDASAANGTRSGVDAISGLTVGGGLTLDGTTIRRISDNAILGGTNGVPDVFTTWNGLTINNSTIQDTNRFNVTSHGDATSEGAVRILGLSGTVIVTNSVFQRGAEFLDLTVTGNMTMTVTGSQFLQAYKEFVAGDLSPQASVGLHGVDVTVQGTANATITIGDRNSVALGNTFLNGRLASLRVGNDVGASGNIDVTAGRNLFKSDDHSSGVSTGGTADFDFPQAGVLMISRGLDTATWDVIMDNNYFDEATNASGGVGQLTMDMSRGVWQALVTRNTFDTPGNAPWFIRAELNATTAKVKFKDNLGIRGNFVCPDASCGGGYFGPGLRSLADVQNGGKMDITIDGDDFAKHDNGFDPGQTVEVRRLNVGAAGTINVHLLNNTAPDGYSLENYDAAGTVNLFRGASASSVPATIVLNNNNLGGAGVATTTPPTVSTFGTITATNTAPQEPALTPLLFDPGRGAANGSLPAAAVNGGVLSQADLDSIVAAALARWTASGLTNEQLATLRSLKFEVADLLGWHLGKAGGDRIRVDNNAGGNGWYIGSTAKDDALFAKEVSATRRYTDPASAPAGRVDLLTAILHEMGHALGLEDSYALEDREDVMYGYLTTGERRTPAEGQAAAVPKRLSTPDHRRR